MARRKKSTDKFPADLLKLLTDAGVTGHYLEGFYESYKLFGRCGAQLRVKQFIWFKKNYDLSNDDTLTVMRSGRMPTKKISSKRRLELLEDWIGENV